MGNKISTIITIVVILIVFMLMISFIVADTQIDESKRVIRTLAEEVQYKGYITYDQYVAALNSIPFKNVKIQLTHFKRDDYNTYLSGTLDMVFTSQIMGSATDMGRDINVNGIVEKGGTLLCAVGDKSNQGIYKFEVGDQIQIDLVVMEGTLFDSIIGLVTGSGAPSIRILAAESGVIVNAKY